MSLEPSDFSDPLRKRSNAVFIRVTDAERKRIQLVSRHYQVGLSTAVRMAIVHWFAAGCPWPVEAPK